VKSILAAISAALVLAAGSPPALSDCLATPVEDANPSAGTRTGIAEPAANNLWVSGIISLRSTNTYPFIERYDPLTGWASTVLWSLQQSAFASIAAVSPQRAIAVGYENGGATALAVTLDGSRWTQSLGGQGQLLFRGSLQKVVAVPHQDAAYAVLAYGSANLLYWNGSTWSAVRDALPTGGVLAVSASSPSDVWAVGGETNSYGIVHGLVERFDGSRWIDLKAPARLTLLTEVDARTVDDVWVTGLTQSGSMFRAYAAHWNGTKWEPAALPMKNSPTAVYGGLYAESASSAWIGAAEFQSGSSRSSLWHWDGRNWRYVTGSVGWTDPPALAGFADDVWFSAGVYRRTPTEGNKWLGSARCDRVPAVHT
jgi:hypothetical protein